MITKVSVNHVLQSPFLIPIEFERLNPMNATSTTHIEKVIMLKKVLIKEVSFSMEVQLNWKKNRFEELIRSKCMFWKG